MKSQMYEHKYITINVYSHTIHSNEQNLSSTSVGYIS